MSEYLSTVDDQRNKMRELKKENANLKHAIQRAARIIARPALITTKDSRKYNCDCCPAYRNPDKCPAANMKRGSSCAKEIEAWLLSLKAKEKK